MTPALITDGPRCVSSINGIDVVLLMKNAASIAQTVMAKTIKNVAFMINGLLEEIPL